MPQYRVGYRIDFHKSSTFASVRRIPDTITIGFSMPFKVRDDLIRQSNALKTSAVISAVTSLGAAMRTALDTNFAGAACFSYTVTPLEQTKP